MSPAPMAGHRWFPSEKAARWLPSAVHLRWPTRPRRCRGTLCLALFVFLAAYALFFGFVLLAVARLDDAPRVGSRIRNFLAGDVVDFSDADNVTGFSRPVVPDVVHYVKFRDQELSFVEMLSILSVHRNHGPSRILMHCSSCAGGNLTGPYWQELVERHGVRVEVRHLAEPTHVFGKRLSSVYHASDVARILLLMEHGGIFLDGDVYVVQPLKRFLHFECTVGWPVGESMGSQVLIAHKNARFLKLWLNSYRWYRPFMWYYNAGQLPTEGILAKRPGLVHRVPILFGVHYLVEELYKRPSWPQWRDYFAIHLLSRHRSYLDRESPVQIFDEKNVKRYRFAFGEMARLLLYNKTEILD